MLSFQLLLVLLLKYIPLQSQGNRYDCYFSRLLYYTLQFPFHTRKLQQPQGHTWAVTSPRHALKALGLRMKDVNTQIQRSLKSHLVRTPTFPCFFQWL